MCTQPVLHNLLGAGEVGLGIDAYNLIFTTFQRPYLQPLGHGRADHVRQVEFASHIAIADMRQKITQGFRTKGHDTGIAQIDGPFLLRCVGILTNGDKRTGFIVNHTPIPCRVPRPEGQNRDLCSTRYGRDETLKGFGFDERGVAIKHQRYTIGQALTQHFKPDPCGVRGSKSLLLPRNDGVGPLPAHQILHGGHLQAGDNRHAGNIERLRRGHDMSQKRPTGNCVQNLGARRLHPRSLSGSQYDNIDSFHGENRSYAETPEKPRRPFFRIRSR